MSDPAGRRNSLQALERGLAVLQVFSAERPALTLSEVSRHTGISRASVRRILITLEELGFVRSSERRFSVTPRVLSLAWAYLSSLNMWDVARPLMEDLVEQTNESCGLATLDLPDVVTVARVPSRRIMTSSVGVGTRLPAYCSAIGRLLLCELPDDELDRYLATAKLEPLTDRTITDPEALRAELAKACEQGWTLVDQELEVGLVSIAVPVRSSAGKAIAGMNLSVATPRVPPDEIVRTMLPQLQRTVHLLEATLTRHAAPRELGRVGGTRRGRAAG